MPSTPPSPLQPVGFGAPDLNYALTPQLASNLQPIDPPDTTGLQILGEAGKSLQQTLSAEAQAGKAREQATSQLAQQQMVATAAIANVTQATIQTRAQSAAQSSSAWKGLGDSVINLASDIAKRDEAAKERDAKIRAAELKARLEQNQLKATTELENLQLGWTEQGRFEKEGTLAYREAVSGILSKYQMEPDTITSLTTKYYGPALDYAKTVHSNYIEEGKKLVDANRNLKYQQLAQSGAAAIAAMATSDPERVQEGFTKYQELFKQVEDDPNLNRLSKIMLATQLLADSNKATSISKKDQEWIRNELAYNAKANDYFNQSAPLVRNGQMTDAEYDQGWVNLALQFGKTPPKTRDVMMNEKAQLEREKFNLDVQATAKQGVQNRIDALAPNEQAVKGLAITMHLNPTALAQVEALVKSGQADKNAVAALALAKEANVFIQKTAPAFQTQSAEINTRFQKAAASGIEDIIAMASAKEGGSRGSDPSLESLRSAIAGLGIGSTTQAQGPVAPTQKYTEAQIAQVQQYKEAVLAAIKRESDTLNQQYQQVAQRFASQGIFTDTSRTKTSLKQFQAAVDTYNRAVADANSAPKPMPMYGGQQPNFSGGISGKPAVAPLRKQVINGKTLYTPFDMANGDMSSGQHYGDSRDGGGRTHDGMDFNTPVGTPLKAMVSGVISQSGVMGGYGHAVAVKGDDGYTYFYAHLDTNGLSVGTKVGAGQTIGKSGNSGTGSGPHLHMEIWPNSAGDSPPKAQMIDPYMHLSTRKFGDATPPVRSANGAPAPVATQQAVPPGAYHLGGGKYLYNGRVGTLGPELTNTPVAPNPELSTIRTFKRMDLTSAADNLTTAEVKSLKALPIAPKIQKPGLDLIGFRMDSDAKSWGVATYRNKQGAVLTQTIMRDPKDRAPELPMSFGLDGRGYKAPAAPKELVFTAPGATPDKLQASAAAGRNAKPIPTKMSFNSFQPQSGSPDYHGIFGGDAPSQKQSNGAFSQQSDGRFGKQAGDNAERVAKRFRAKGMPEEIIAAALVNAHVESGFSGDAVGDGGHSIGFFQLNDVGFGNYSQGHRSNVENNADLIHSDHGYAKVLAAYKSGTRDIPTLAALWSKEVERPGDEAGQMALRRSIAKKYFPSGLTRRSGGGGGPAPNTPRALPPGSFRISPTKYLAPDGSVKMGSHYTPASPLQPSFAPSSIVAYAREVPGTEETFNYEQLKENPSFLDEIKTIAKNHDVPAQWVTDAAMLKGTSGIRPETLKDMSNTLATHKKGSLKTTQDFVAAAIPEMDAKEANHSLGVHAGRRYDSTFTQLELARTPVHEHLNKNCSICAALSGQQIFTPHIAERIM